MSEQDAGTISSAVLIRSFSHGRVCRAPVRRVCRRGRRAVLGLQVDVLLRHGMSEDALDARAPQAAVRRDMKDLATNDGATPLFIAAHNGHIDVARSLLGAGADKTAMRFGKTALDVAETAEMKELLSVTTGCHIS